MKHWKVWLVLIVLGALGIYVADFYLERYVHYKLSYQSLVEGTIRDMVKSSCLVK